MKFSELEQLKLDNGITALADIARFLKTTPQAVSIESSRSCALPHNCNVAKFQDK